MTAINVKSATAHMQTAGKAYCSASMASVSAILCYAMRFAYGKADMGPYKRVAESALLKAGVPSKTANRHVNYAFGAASFIRRKMPENASVKAILECEDMETLSANVASFLSGMGIVAADDVRLWTQGDGNALSAKAKRELRQPAKAKAQPAKAAADDVATDEPETPNAKAAGDPDVAAANDVANVMKKFWKLQSEDRLQIVLSFIEDAKAAHASEVVTAANNRLAALEKATEKAAA